jgi:hypothetical protein
MGCFVYEICWKLSVLSRSWLCFQVRNGNKLKESGILCAFHFQKPKIIYISVCEHSMTDLSFKSQQLLEINLPQNIPGSL